MQVQILGCTLVVLWSLLGFSTPVQATLKHSQSAPISQRFLTTVSFPYQGPIPQHVVYGNEQYGYFRTDAIKLQRGWLAIELVPPGYRHAVNFYVRPTVLGTQAQGPAGLQRLGEQAFTSPVPGIYQGLTGQVVHGRFSSNFFIVTGALPRGVYWNHDFKTHNPEVFSRSRFRFSFTMILNRLGEIVWIHVPVDGKELFHSYIVAKQVGKGTYGMMLGKKAGYFQLVDYKGQIIRDIRSRDVKRPFTMHHDFLMASNDSLIAISSRRAVSQSPKAKSIGKTFLADTLIQIDLLGKDHRQVFDFLKIYRPAVNHFWTGDDEGDHKFYLWNEQRVDFDFLHLNSIQQLSDGYLVGVRNLNKVVMMDNKLNRVKWSLGWNEDDTFQIKSDEDRFHHMHTPLRLANGNIAMFDNGYERSRSRVVEYELDFKRQQAKVAWSFAPSPRLYSKDRGSIAPLENRNIIAYFVNPVEGTINPNPTPPRDVLIEVDYRSRLEKARMVRTFNVLSPGYRAVPIDVIGTEEFIGANL
jgi:hypothetical protein